jgi:hypothetical protein
MRQHDPDWKKLIAALVVVSTVLILAPCWALGYLTTKEVVFAASNIGLVSAMVGGGWTIYRRWLWRSKWLQLWITHPDIGGVWKGLAVSTHGGEPIPVTMTILQTFTTLDISLRTDTQSAISFSLAGALVSDWEINRHRVIYTYLNEPSPLSTGSEMHFGTAILDIEGTPPTKLLGHYLTARQPQTRGTIELNREPTLSAPRSLAVVRFLLGF